VLDYDLTDIKNSVQLMDEDGVLITLKVLMLIIIGIQIIKDIAIRTRLILLLVHKQFFEKNTGANMAKTLILMTTLLF
jgi:hypothetical protein